MPTNGQAVKIAHYTRSKFNSLTTKDSATIYYVEETDGEIKQYIGSVQVVSDIPNLPASKITSGTFSASRIPSLSPSKITQDASNRFVTDTEKSTWNGKATTSYVDGKTYLKSNTDNRAVDTIPNDYNSKFDIKGLKQNTTLGITGQGSYSALLGIRGWSGDSGGNSHEFALTGNGEIYHRHGATTTWNPWDILAKQSWVTANTRSSSWTPTWSQVTSKPTWIGSSKPSYTASEVGAAASSHSHSVATTSAAGFLSAADKTKLNGIATNATANTGTVTNVSAGTTQVSGLTLLVANGTTTPTISTSISDPANFRAAIGAAPTSHTHSQYLTSFTETDPTVPAHVKSITSGNISSWNGKFNTPTGTTAQYVRGNGSLASFPTIPTIPGIMDTTEGNTGTAATQRTINAKNLKDIILNHSPAGSRPASDVSAWAKKSSLAIGDIPTGTTGSTVALGNHTHSAATTSAAGFMSSADKTKLNGIATNADKTPTNIIRQVSFSGGTMVIEVL